jgi:hypothetical protein
MLALLPLALPLASAEAAEFTLLEPHEGGRPLLVELHGGFSYYYYGGAMVGARVGIPIVSNGFIPPLNNSVYINVGADAYFYTGSLIATGGGVGIGVPVALQWNFYFTEDWSAFAEAGVNVFLDPNRTGSLVYPWLSTAIGGRYHFSDKLALHGRAGYPYTSIGVEFSL